MGIQIGNSEVTNIQVGNTPVTAVYAGSTLVWPTERWNVIYENTDGLVLNPNQSSTAITLGKASTESNKFRITYEYEIIPEATIYDDYCFYRNPSLVYFTQETLPPQNTINTIEVERTSPTDKGVNLFLLGCRYRYDSYNYSHGAGVRLSATTTGMLVGYPTRNGGTGSIDYTIKMTIYKVEQLI